MSNPMAGAADSVTAAAESAEGAAEGAYDSAAEEVASAAATTEVRPAPTPRLRVLPQVPDVTGVRVFPDACRTCSSLRRSV